MKKSVLKPLLILFFIFSFSIINFSCSKEEVTISVGEANFRLINAVSGSPDQDFFQSDKKLNNAPLVYAQSSDLIKVRAGSTKIAFKAASNQSLSASLDVGLNTDANYTVFYFKNSNGNGELNGYQEATILPPTGSSGVRFLSLGANLTSPVVVKFGNGDPLSDPLQFGVITKYAVIDPSKELQFFLESSPANAMNIPSGTFKPGFLYTIWFDVASSTNVQYHVVQQK